MLIRMLSIYLYFVGIGCQSACGLSNRHDGEYSGLCDKRRAIYQRWNVCAQGGVDRSRCWTDRCAACCAAGDRHELRAFAAAHDRPHGIQCRKPAAGISKE